jgi:eukaryotic-like serine/threonine-protein kinase
MALTPGTKFGPYEIVCPLGAGGMGEVYRACDTRLGRDVAIKVLPETLARDPDRLLRFNQEARVLGTLNHPNLLAVYGVGSGQGVHYLVSEFLEGKTLSQLLSEGPLSRRKLVEFSTSIANGLAAAHEKGIVHRDLKPDNIFITKSEQIKILDFGLAKSTSVQSGSAITMEDVAHTEKGTVMGTVGYMSPEQVRGLPSDARSDIFSFGAVFYEMLTGNRAFRRDTPAETMTAILREEPPELTGNGWQAAPGLQRILRRCLEKNVERRFQSASDLGFAIESLSGSTSAPTSPHGVTIGRPIWWHFPAVALGMLALGALVWLAVRPPAARPPAKFSRLTFQQGFLSNARFVKGGDTVVYSAQWNNEPMQLYSVRREFPQSVKIDLPSAAMLGLSPNGDLLLAQDPVYHAGFLSGTMAQAPMSGGTPHSLEDGVISADYSPDGTSKAVARHANGKVQLEFPAGHVIYTTSGYLDYVRISPSGKEIAFLEHRVYDDDLGSVAMVDAGGNHKKLTEEFGGSLQGLAWSPSGREIWFSAASEGADLQLFAVTPSGKQRAILGAPQRTRILDIASDGRVLLSNEQYRREVVGVDSATGKEHRRLEWFNTSGLVDISSDGKAILFIEFQFVGPLYLVAYRKLDGSPPVALGPGAWPKFSPDGTTAAAVVLSNPPQVALHPIGTGESRRLTLGDLVNVIHVSWFPDGKHLLLTGSTEGRPLRTYTMDTVGGKPQPLGPPDFTGIAVSMDGKRIAGRITSGQAAVFTLDTEKVEAIPGMGPGDQFEKWSEDGKALIVSTSTPWEAHVDRVEVDHGKRTVLQKVELTEKAGANLNMGLAYAEGSRTYVYNTRRILGTLYVVEGLQ